MPKIKGKGGKSRKWGKQELIFRLEDQEYALVLRMLVNGRCDSPFLDGTKRLCDIRGAMHKGRIASGDAILVGFWDYQVGKANAIHEYQPDEARLLKAYGELPNYMRLNEGQVPPV